MGVFVASSQAWAAPAFVQQASAVGPPASLSMSLSAGNTVVLAIWGPTSYFPVGVTDDVGSSFVLAGPAVNGSGALSGTSAQLAYARVTTGGPRVISVAGSGSSNGMRIRAVEFSGVTPNYAWFAYYTATGGPADGRSVLASADAVVFAHVLASGAILDGGTGFNALTGTSTEYLGWLPAPSDGDYPLLVPVTGAWVTSLASLGPRLVEPDAGTDGGADAGSPGDGGAGDGGAGDGGAGDGGASADGGTLGDGGLGEDGGASADGGRDGGGAADGGGGGGSGAGAVRELVVGCGCSASPAPAVLALLLVSRRALRRRRR